MLATAATRGIGTGLLPAADCVAKAFNPIALVKTDSANTITASHLFISFPRIKTLHGGAYGRSGAVSRKIFGCVSKEYTPDFLGPMRQSLAELSSQR